MSFLTTDLPSTLLLIAIGVIIGAALTKILNRGPNPAELQQQLEDTQDQFASYQKEVGGHFQKTADLVNNLTNSYQEVHQHLSLGAQKLAQSTPETLENTQFKALSDDNASKNNSEEKHSSVAPSYEETANSDLSSSDLSSSDVTDSNTLNHDDKIDALKSNTDKPA